MNAWNVERGTWNVIGRTSGVVGETSNDLRFDNHEGSKT